MGLQLQTCDFLTRRIRASEDFSVLLDWDTFDLSEETIGQNDLVGVPSAALKFMEKNCTRYGSETTTARSLMMRQHQFLD